MRARTRGSLEKVRAVLRAKDGVEDVLMFPGLPHPPDDFTAINEVYAAFLAEHVRSGGLPARTTVFVDLRHEVMLAEIDALAVTDWVD